MKRVALLCMGLAMGVASVAEAQLTMQMSNGWSFTFGGNVNAFFTYENGKDDGGLNNSDALGNPVGPQAPGGIVASASEGASRIRTGLLPAFAVFDAKGKEGNTDLGVHFGFAPQINLAAGEHDNFGGGTGLQAGAQIDMRQVYLTVGGTWGQILAGRELGLYGRQNILTDQTLFGVGATGGSAPGTGKGTTLG
ncbi:MAG: porin, partial [Gemmatimonadota bacterium]|nr:porin [Gemmatimonadota bacterium]